jgi:hypothetical protein
MKISTILECILNGWHIVEEPTDFEGTKVGVDGQPRLRLEVVLLAEIELLLVIY